MPIATKKKKPPEKLRPYIFHGLDLDWESGEEQLTTDCPFCDREGHFSINRSTGKWRCRSCGQGNEKQGGNAIVFIRMLWQQSDEATKAYQPLATERRLQPDTLMYWGVCRSTLTGDWLVPGYSVAKKDIVQLYYLRDIGSRISKLSFTIIINNYLLLRY